MNNIYFFKEDAVGSIKIGISHDVPRRLQQIQMCSPQKIEFVAAMPGDRAAEILIQEKFSHLKIHGEWFKADDELMSYIQENANSSIPSSPPRPKRKKRTRKALKNRRIQLKIS